MAGYAVWFHWLLKKTTLNYSHTYVCISNGWHAGIHSIIVLSWCCNISLVSCSLVFNPFIFPCTVSTTCCYSLSAPAIGWLGARSNLCCCSVPLSQLGTSLSPRQLRSEAELWLVWEVYESLRDDVVLRWGEFKKGSSTIAEAASLVTAKSDWLGKGRG